MNRRLFLQLMTTTSGLLVSGKSCATFATANAQFSNKISSSMSSNSSFFMPDEGEPHLCTWMAFSASPDIWGRRYSSGVQNNLARIAKTIVKYEPVKMLVRKGNYEVARAKCGPDVELIVCPIDDLWMRDTGCIFVVNDAGDKAAIDPNFNGCLLYTSPSPRDA